MINFEKSISKKELNRSYRIKSYYETKDYVYMFFTRADVPYFALYHKRTKQTDVLKYTATKNDVTFEKFGNFVMGVDYDTNKLIFIVLPSSLMAAKNDILKVAPSPQRDKVSAMISKINLASNPVIGISILKD